MAQVNGKLVTCDRCGAQVFLKCTGEGERDGGFTRWNKFEPFPEGWEVYHIVGLICPDCHSKYKTIISNFMAEARDDGHNRTAGE